MRAKHGGVPKAATGLSEAREAAERQRAPERAFHNKYAPKKTTIILYKKKLSQNPDFSDKI